MPLRMPAPWTNGTLWALPSMVALSFALNWPYLGSGFLADEIVILAAMERDPLPYSRWRGAWSGDASDLSWFGDPWWAEPGAMGNFFRPLPSLVFEGSLRLFGRVAFPLHLLAVALHGVIAFLLVLILTSLCGSRAPPVLAGILWVACEDHSMTVGFPSFATDILCVFFVCLSLLAHLAWLRSRRPLHLVGTAVALLAALGCKETAAVAPLALVVTSLLFPRGRASDEVVGLHRLRGRLKALWRDPASWAPWLGVLLGFVALYALLGLGGMDNLTYVDPTTHPGRYASHLVIHLPVMWLATLTVVPPGLGFFDPAAFLPMAVAGAVLFPIFLWVLGPRLRRPVVAWGLVLYLLALLPQLGTDASERLLYLPFAFAAVALALPIMDVGPLARRLAQPSSRVGRLRRLAGWYLLVGVGVAGLVLSARLPLEYIAWSRPGVEDPVTAARHVLPEHERVVFLTTRDFFGLLMVPTIVEEEVGRDLDLRILSASRARATIRKLSDTSFVLRLDRPGWLTSFLAAAFRREPAIEAGRAYPGDLYDVTIVELTADEADVLAVRVDMHLPLADPRTVFLRWSGAEYAPVDLRSLATDTPYPLDEAPDTAG